MSRLSEPSLKFFFVRDFVSGCATYSNPLFDFECEVASIVKDRPKVCVGVGQVHVLGDLKGGIVAQHSFEMEVFGAGASEERRRSVLPTHMLSFNECD